MIVLSRVAVVEIVRNKRVIQESLQHMLQLEGQQWQLRAGCKCDVNRSGSFCLHDKDGNCVMSESTLD